MEHYDDKFYETDELDHSKAKYPVNLTINFHEHSFKDEWRVVELYADQNDKTLISKIKDISDFVVDNDFTELKLYW